jgi:lysophospholipid acyltransferase (LPLAT)-like uncharacterized protein
MTLRKRIANSPAVNNAVARVMAGYIRLVKATSRWDYHGFDVMEQALSEQDAIICALWHDRLTLSPYLFDTNRHPICTLTSEGRAGKLVGIVQTRFGFSTLPMSSHKRHVALSRAVLSEIKKGTSVGIAIDGPRGPSRESKTFPLIWARSTGKPIMMITYSVKHARHLPAWDKMLLPRLFNRGVFMCRPFSRDIPRKMTDEQMEDLRLCLQNEMNALTKEADTLSGYAGPTKSA